MRHFVMSVCLLLGACGGSKIDEAISKGEAIGNRLCECKDLECAQKANDDLEAWKKALPVKELEEEEQKMSAEDKAKLKTRMNAIRDKVDKCHDEWKAKGLKRSSG